MKNLKNIFLLLIAVVATVSCTDSVQRPHLEEIYNEEGSPYSYQRSFLYNDRGQLHEIRVTDTDGVINQFDRFYYQGGKLVSQVSYLDSGTVVSRRRYEYGIEGRLNNRLTEGDGGIVLMNEKFLCDGESGRITGIVTYDSGGSEIGKREFIYNSEQVLVRENLYDSDGKIALYKIYDLSDSGIITIKYFDAFENSERLLRVTKRIFEIANRSPVVSISGIYIYAFD